jgi:hypothetical protein
MIGFSVLCRNIDTENAGKITICYTEEFAAKYHKACKKHNRLSSDFNEIFIEKVLKKSINGQGEITRGDARELQRVGCDGVFRAYKVRKFWSSDLGRQDGIRLDYIFVLPEMLLVFVDIRFKSNNQETNHDEKMIRMIMECVKSKDYELVDS